MHTISAAESTAGSTSNRTGRTVPSPSFVLVILMALLLSAICLKFLPMPFVWIGWGWSVTLFAGAWYLRAGWIRVVTFNVAVFVVVLAATETFWGLTQPAPPIYSDPYYVDDDVLGVVPMKGIRAHSTRSEHGKLLYDVTYTIDSNGLRIAPPHQASSPDGSVLFFGCSFTFGEGVQDDETVPYQLGIQSGGRYKVYNFGFHGYGPNQMLALIESGRLRQVVDTPPRFAIYQALPDHVARVAGKIPYGKHSPRYLLGTDGTVRLNGHFDDGQVPPSYFQAHLRGQLRKSAIYRTLENLRPRTNENDVRLLLATVRRSRELLEAEYPGIEFRVILWRNFAYEQPLYEALQKGFAQLNIPVTPVNAILTDYDTAPQKYLLSEANGHPNAWADRMIANYLVTKILPQNPEIPPLINRR